MRTPRKIVILFDRRVEAPTPRSVRPQRGSHIEYSRDELCGRIGRTRDAVGPVVATDNCEVTLPLDVGVTEVGLSAQVGARAGAGETEQVSDTGPLNPYIALAVSVKTAELPAFRVAFPGVALTPKPATTWLNTAEVLGAKSVAPLYVAVTLWVATANVEIVSVANPSLFKAELPKLVVPSRKLTVPVGRLW